MAHYPIKCTYCFKEIPNAEVLFCIKDKQQTGVPGRWEVKRNLDAGRTAAPQQQKEETGFLLLPDKTKYFETDDAKKERPNNDRDQFVTVDQLKMRFPEGNVSPKNYPVAVTPEFSGKKATEEEALFTEVEYTDEEENRMVLRHRYCPYCQSRLPSLSGTIPTYLVTVLGTSDSGKTVYLAALYQMLKNGQRKIRIHLGQLDGDAAEDDMLIAELSKKLYSNGILPATTLENFPEPVTFQLIFSLKMEAGNLAPQKECIFALADMKGEDLTAAEGDTLVRMHEKYRSSDAFLFLVDPENTPGYHDAAGENQNRPEAHGRLTTLVRDHIAGQFRGGNVDKPTAIVMTKVDKFFTLSKKRAAPGFFRHISATLSPDTTAVMAKSNVYFEQLDSETQIIFREFDNNLYAFLQRTFPTAIYTNVAALGSDPEIFEEENSEIEKIKNPNIETAIRLEDPLLLLLSQLHFVPPYETMPPVIPVSDLPPRPTMLNFEKWKRWNEMNKRAQTANEQVRGIVNEWRDRYTLNAPSGKDSEK